MLRAHRDAAAFNILFEACVVVGGEGNHLIGLKAV